jgi:hypothetical protein
MGHTFYDGTIVVLQSVLDTLSHILHQAEKAPNANALPEARLHADMYPLTDQIRLAVQFTENLTAKVSGREPTTYEGSPLTFAEFHERIETVRKSLNEADKNYINENYDKDGPTKIAPTVSIDVTNAVYAHRIALPNIYFHLTTAYGILRKEGVPLGKVDYFTGFFPPGEAKGY